MNRFKTRAQRALAAFLLLVAAVAVVGSPAEAGLTTGATVWYPTASPNSGSLITNEYAFYNPTLPDRVESTHWNATSGSVFGTWVDGVGWAYDTGALVPGAPDADSNPNTNSNIWRVVSKPTFGDVSVLSIVNAQSMHSFPGITPAVDWDGLHYFLRYQSEESLYYVSVVRRDGRMVIKKKCPGGGSNGGTYYTLAQTAANAYPPLLGTPRWRGASIRTLADGSVEIKAYHISTVTLTAIDNGTGCAQITNSGSVGFRGDNTRMQLNQYHVRSYAG